MDFQAWYRMTVEERVDILTLTEPNSGCWFWMGGLTPSGYGQVRVGGKVIRAHRFNYERFNGPIPQDLIVRHTCDVRCCICPDHLILGTHEQNTGDAIKRGRFPAGNTARRLSEEQVHLIFSRRLVDEPASVLAKQFGVSTAAIWKVKNGRSYKEFLATDRRTCQTSSLGRAVA